MKPFLEKIADRLLEKFSCNMQDVQVVLPSKRAVVFFKHYISKKIDKPIFLPKIHSIEDFILQVSGLELLDNISLQFRLYHAYNITAKSKPDSFDNFLKWSRVLLNDYNDIDKSLADAKKIYTNLHDLKELDGWSVDNWSLAEKELTPLQENYMSFFEHMFACYEKFNSSLLSSKLAYQGLAYKVASEKIVDYDFAFQKVWFVGLNALTISEQVIIDFLKKEDVARVFWDADEFYYNNPIHEAGGFLRDQRKKWHEIDFQGVGNYWSRKKDAFQMIACPKSISQVRVAGELLDSFQELDLEKSNTAVVFADESLLLPMLHHLPASIKKINITMGSELKHTSLFSFIQTIFNMQIHMMEYKKQSFYYKDLLDLTSHPYFIQLVSRDSCIAFKKELVQRKKIFLKPSDVIASFPLTGKLENIFSIWKSGKEAIFFLEKIINDLFEYLVQKKGTVESEVLVVFNKVIILLKKLLDELGFTIELKTLHLIFNQLVASERVPFQGEPLEGVQLMGILESRTLDFKNIIMLSVNEGILPKGKSTDSFIPYDVRKYFKLSTSADRDAVFSYHFYRLLQRAKNISLIYNSETDDFGIGEKSRFLTQLASEYKAGKIKHMIYQGETPSLINQNNNRLVVENNNLSTEIKIWMENGVSPSAIIKYNNCSLSFYYHYLARIRPEKKIEEFAESSTIGTVIHNALEQHYPIGNLTEKKLKDILSSISATIKTNFEDEISKESLENGKNYLSLKVAQKITKAFLNLEIRLLQEAEKRSQKIKIIAKEKKLEHELILDKICVKLVGFVDRIDMIGDIVRIIDYKTGKVNQSDLIIKNIDELIDNPKKSKAFQLFMYIYLYIKNNTDSINQDICSAIFSFRNLKSGLLFLSTKEKGVEKKLNINQAVIQQFEKKLKSILLRIMNDDFIETEDRNLYEWIDYESIYKL